MRSVVDRDIVMRPMTVLSVKHQEHLTQRTELYAVPEISSLAQTRTAISAI